MQYFVTSVVNDCRKHYYGSSPHEKLYIITYYIWSTLVWNSCAPITGEERAKPKSDNTHHAAFSLKCDWKKTYDGKEWNKEGRDNNYQTREKEKTRTNWTPRQWRTTMKLIYFVLTLKKKRWKTEDTIFLHSDKEINLFCSFNNNNNNGAVDKET